MTESKITESNYYEKATSYILGISVILSVIQFFSGRSLWMDEAFLGLNIAEKSYLGLLQHLDHAQVAPPLFLLIEKFFFTIIPDPDMALRFFPLLSFWSSLFFYKKLTKLYIQSESARFVAISLLSLSTYMLFYACEVKQYMTDTAVTTGIFLLVLSKKISPEKRSWLIAASGIIILFISHISVIILASVGLYLLIEALNKNSYKSLILTGMIWGICFGVIYLFFIHNHPTRTFMLDFWSRQQAFMPLNPMSVEFAEFTIKQAATICTLIIPELKVSSRILLPLLMISGVVAIYRSKSWNIRHYLLITPVIIHLILSSLKLYPFDARLYLYTIPIFIISVGIGWEFIQKRFSRSNDLIWKFAPLIFPLLSLTGLYIHGFPLKKNEIKPLLSYYQENAKPDEGLYISIGASHIAEYYHQTGFFSPKGPFFLSKMDWEDSSSQRVQEIEALGEKVWLIFNIKNMDVVSDVTSRLNKLGYKMIYKNDNTFGSIYLYDLRKSSCD